MTIVRQLLSYTCRAFTASRVFIYLDIYQDLKNISYTVKLISYEKNLPSLFNRKSWV